MSLSPRQTKFVAEYLKSGNATDAYVAAGYSRKGADAAAARLLGNVRISEEVQKGLALISRDSEVTAVSLMRDLETVKRRCMQAEPVLDSQGNPTGEYKFDSKGALRAIELQGKKLGIWDPDKEKPPIDLPPITGGELSTTQLIHLILEKRQRMERRPEPARVVETPAPAETPNVEKQPEPELPSFAGLQEFPDKQ